MEISKGREREGNRGRERKKRELGNERSSLLCPGEYFIKRTGSSFPAEQNPT
jgi:hypothetical protein